MMPGNIYTLLTQIWREFSQPIGDKSIVMMESPAHQIVPPFWYAIPGVGKSKTFPAWCVLRLIRKVIPKGYLREKRKGIDGEGKGVVQVEKNKKKNNSKTKEICALMWVCQREHNMATISHPAYSQRQKTEDRRQVLP